MSRSGYSDDIENWELIKWRGQVASAIRGKWGQAFLQELLEALDQMPEKRLIRDVMRDEDGCVCAMGAVGVKRGLDLDSIDPHDCEQLSRTFGIAHQLAQEIMFLNDDWNDWNTADSPEHRWQRMRDWVVENLATPKPSDSASSEDSEQVNK